MKRQDTEIALVVLAVIRNFNSDGDSAAAMIFMKSDAPNRARNRIAAGEPIGPCVNNVQFGICRHKQIEISDPKADFIHFTCNRWGYPGRVFQSAVNGRPVAFDSSAADEFVLGIHERSATAEGRKRRMSLDMRKGRKGLNRKEIISYNYLLSIVVIR
jgi:hypothetical protein